MKPLEFYANGRISTQPEQVVAGFCTAPSREEAQQRLWLWVRPVVLKSLHEPMNCRLEDLTAYCEHLERLIEVVYRGLEAKRKRLSPNYHG